MLSVISEQFGETAHSSRDSLSQTQSNCNRGNSGDLREEEPEVTNVSIDSDINAGYDEAENVESLPNHPESDKPLTEYYAREGDRLGRESARLYHLAWSCDPEYAEQVRLAAHLVGLRAADFLSIPAVAAARRARLDENIRVLYGKR